MDEENEKQIVNPENSAVEKDKQQDTLSKPDTSFVNMQIEQAMETYRSQFNLLVSILTVLVVANVTVVGYAMTVRTAGIIMVGAIFPIMIYYVIYRVNRLMIPIVYTAVRLEQEFGGKEIDWLATTFIGGAVSIESLRTLTRFNEEPSQDKRFNMIRDLKIAPGGSGKGLTRLALVLTAIGELVVPFLLTTQFGWAFL